MPFNNPLKKRECSETLLYGFQSGYSNCSVILMKETGQSFAAYYPACIFILSASFTLIV